MTRRSAGMFLAVVSSVLLGDLPLLAQPASPVPAELLAEMARDGRASYLVVLRDRADVGPAARLPDRNARGRFVYDALKAVAERSQRPLRDVLESERAAGRVSGVRAFISVNAIGVTSTAASLLRLAAFPQVERIVPLPVLEIPAPIPGAPQAAVQNVEWNIAKVRAPEVWARGFTGQGIVVANIDTGVQYDHPALADHYRGFTGSGFTHDYNWWDATGTCSTAPCDGNGHGTHTMGTMVGDDGDGNQIGVAPGARWISCKAFTDAGGTLFDLLECGDWVLAPWDLNGANPDPARRPHIVNNSWGFMFGGFSILRTMVQNWRAAGIFPAFSAGNSGPGCGTTTSPGDYPESFAAGAANDTDTIAAFSSRGPSLFGPIKPDITAPGVNIRSSVPGSGYAVYSGTSMASPHVAGLVALLWSEYPNLVRDIANTERTLRPAAEILNSPEACGGQTATSHPNNTFGWGRADAWQTRNPFPVYTDRSAYRGGDTISTFVSLLNARNVTWPVDAYLGVELPDGEAFLFPFGTIAVPAGLEVFDALQFSATFTGTEPPGRYRWFSLLVVPGGDPNNPADQISLDDAPFDIAP